ncbi:MAG: rod shape-determining protein MreD [Deltaproteobacteria bacterium]|nr:rod shape-determining protein MreD [Deltaproteobacteria bacterium]MBW2445029.1 rod shape-determining protein MreD [Deltaproteobacteria bacterium]
MKPAIALALAGITALILRGALAGAIPQGFHPDLVLVVVVALGLLQPGATGLLIAAGLGCMADVLTGALLGQHALLFVVAFAITRLAGAQLDLRRAAPTAFLVAALSVAYGLGSVALSRLFADGVAWPAAGRLASQAAIDGLLAPLVLPFLSRVVQALTDDDRRAVPLAPRRREA